MTIKKTKESNVEKKSNKHRSKIIAMAVISAIITSIAIVSYKQDNTPVNGFSTIDGIGCDSMEYSVFHIHTHLDVFVNSQPLMVPASIGIHDNTCLYWLHTHKTDGIIHIEAPKSRDFSLKEFFDIWKSTSTGSPPTNVNPIIYVNGQVVSTSLKDTMLNAHDEIVLVYGNPPSNIPRFYQFPEGL